MNRQRSLRADSLEDLEKRLASWRAAAGPAWMMGAAPKVIAELEAEIASRRRNLTP